MRRNNVVSIVVTARIPALPDAHDQAVRALSLMTTTAGAR